jgi:hypothetical protein
MGDQYSMAFFQKNYIMNILKASKWHYNYILIISCLQVFQIKSEIHVLYIQDWSCEVDFIKLWWVTIIESIDEFEPKLKQYFLIIK